MWTEEKLMKGYMNIDLVSSQIFQPVKNLSGTMCK